MFGKKYFFSCKQGLELFFSFYSKSKVKEQRKIFLKVLQKNYEIIKKAGLKDFLFHLQNSMLRGRNRKRKRSDYDLESEEYKKIRKNPINL